jgi:deoxyribose-phosphate aldolase
VAARIARRFSVSPLSLVPSKALPELDNWVPHLEVDGASDVLLASRIDHTLLRPDIRQADLVRLCDEARAFHFATVCVNGAHVAACRNLLQGSSVRVCSVVGFPLGANTSSVKAFEAADAVRHGAREIDMVIDISALKEQDDQRVRDDIHAVVRAARSAKVKVILETAALSDEEIIAGCMLARLAGAAFVKTSTGFGSGGATLRDVALLRWAVVGALRVKASGGIRSRERALDLLRAGADRIGASASIAIVSGSGPNDSASGAVPDTSAKEDETANDTLDDRPQREESER